ncbi:MAG TPA: PAS domain-containing protein [Longimicrobium sp.]|nr:PAS domain-containing protein [Longimicrobium sp.]
MTQTGTAIPLFAAPEPGAGERARLAQEASGLGVWDWDVERDELHWDEVARALHGVEPGARVSGELLRSRIDPDDRPAMEAAVRASLDPAVRGPCEASYRVRVAGGERWIHAVGRVVWAGEGLSARAVRVIGTIRDDTRARAAERALAERDERLRAALYASGTGTFRWDIRTNALDWDENLDRLFGLEPGRTVRSLAGFIGAVHPDDRERVADACARCAEGGADFDQEFRVVWPDGTVRWLDDKGRTFFGPDGEPSYMTGACIDITDRKRAAFERERLLGAQQAAAALARQRLAELEAFYAGAPVGLAMLDRELRYTRVNDQMAALHGRPAHEHVGRTPAEMMPFPGGQVEAALRQVLETGKPLPPFPLRGALPGSPAERAWLVSFYPVPGLDGAAAGVGAVIDEITEVERATAALRQSEGRLRRILESGIVGAFFWHVDGRITGANDAFLSLVGYTRGDLEAGRVDWRALTPPAWKDEDEGKVAELLATGRHGPYQKEYLAADGRAVPVLIASAFFEGSQSEGVALCLDRTAQHSAEQALLQRGQQLRDALAETERARAAAEQTAAHLHRQNAVASALATALSEEEIARALIGQAAALLSAQAALVLRYQAGELVCVSSAGHSDTEMNGWSRYPATLGTPAGDVARTGEEVYIESAAGWEARYPRWADWVAAHGYTAYAGLPLRFGGRVGGVLVLNFAGERHFTLQDRETLRAMAAAAAQAFERARLFREAVDARREAEAARAQAETANQAKSAFLAAMSHDLRTPLNAIAGYTDLLEMGIRGPVNEAQLNDLSRIRRSTQHLLGLINNVLEFAKLSAGSLGYDLRDLPLSPLLDDAEIMVATQAAARGLRLSLRPCPPGVHVRADGEKVQQILLNLLGNAIKFTPPGGVVEVESEVEGDAVRVHVRDTGVGIPADRLGSVFEPFVQVGGGRPGEGVGLGLAISRELARAMGGEISARSAPGQGSTFTLVLPRAPHPPPTAG